MLSACTGLRTCVRARMLLASGEGCIDGRGASFAVSAVEVLKASGPQGLAMSQSPHPGDLWTCHDEHTRAALVGLGLGGGWLQYNSPRDDGSQTPLEGTHLSFFMQKPLSASQVSCEGCEAGRII